MFAGDELYGDDITSGEAIEDVYSDGCNERCEVNWTDCELEDGPCGECDSCELRETGHHTHY